MSENNVSLAHAPPFIGKELDYVKEAIKDNHKICGDGPFTKKCNKWMEEKFLVDKVLLTTSPFPSKFPENIE